MSGCVRLASGWPSGVGLAALVPVHPVEAHNSFLGLDSGLHSW